MHTNYAILIRTLPPNDLEDFVSDWLKQRTRDYLGHELWRGSGDMGRDVTGYVTTNRMEGLWDNFQCKQLNKSLTETEALVEIGKIFMHSANGKYSLPRAYFFVSPFGVGRAVQHLVAHPEEFRQVFLDRWDTSVAKRLVAKKTILLTPEIRAKIEAFDFNQIDWFDATRLANDPACKLALVKWFGSDPGPSPRGTVPSEVQEDESVYIGQLLKLYSEKGPGSYPDAPAAMASTTYRRHLSDQRTRFFDWIAFDRYYRDSTPEDYLKEFKEDIYSGTADIHYGNFENGLAKLSQVMTTVGSLPLTGILGKHAGPRVKQGACHQLANDEVLPWDR